MFKLSGDMITWVCVEALKLGFDIAMKRFNLGSNKRKVFCVTDCKTDDEYKKNKWKIKM